MLRDPNDALGGKRTFVTLSTKDRIGGGALFAMAVQVSALTAFSVVAPTPIPSYPRGKR